MEKLCQPSPSCKNLYACVLVDISLGRDKDPAFDYAIPDELAATVTPGMRVLVPFGNKRVEGFVLSLKDTTDIAPQKIKPIISAQDDFAAIKPEVLKILDPIADQFKLRKIDVLRLFIPASLRGRKRKRKPKNAEIRGLEIKEKQITLTPQQQKIIDIITNDGGFSNGGKTFLLHGVTGSGKTEVYMNVIDRVLARNQTAIMLVPEIGLTPQVLGNFRTRFGDQIAILHSGLTTGERFDEWFRLFTGDAKIAIGARSAIFSPQENIGVIIVDEEHDGSYSSESNPRFATHEIAKLRCNHWGASLVLGSATPSIATYHKAKTGDYNLLTLDKRVNNLAMPKIELVNMAAEIRAGNGGIFSRSFMERLVQTQAQGKQAIVFLNRRGFSSFVMCKGCGWVAKCEHCDVSLVYHKDDRQLKCHYCASRFSSVSKCPDCSGDYLKFGATGTQKVAEELQAKFGDSGDNSTGDGGVRIFRLDADTTKNRGDLLDILSEFARTPGAILVGTQMLAKGFDFPDVTFVGIVDADNSLHFSDYRAAERTFALVTQVAGRCGRDASIGHVVLQTFCPRHYVYQIVASPEDAEKPLAGYEKFYEKEINTRQVTKYPPFTTIVRVLVTGERDDKIKDALKEIMADLRVRAKDFIYLGAMKSPLGRLDDKFRYQILCRFPIQNEKEMLDFVDEAVRNHQPKGVNIFLEINPQSLS